MVALLGAERSDLDLPRSFAQPLSLMMCGLHGSGKTTSSGKLARLLAAEDRKTLLVGADVYRPAAMDQLETLAKQLDLPCFLMRGEQDVLKIADGAMAKAKADGIDVVIFDTAGRLQIDDTMVKELVRLRRPGSARAKSCSCSTLPRGRRRSASPHILTKRWASPARS